MIIRKGRKENDSKTSEYRYLSSVEESPAVTNIYGDKIAIIIWTDEPEGIIIENPAAAKAYKSYLMLCGIVLRKQSNSKLYKLVIP